jgi:hypothetical protein
MEYKFKGKIFLKDFVKLNNYHLKTTYTKGWKLVLFLGFLIFIIIMVIKNIHSGINSIIDFYNHIKYANNNVNISSFSTMSIILYFIREFLVTLFIILFVPLFYFFINRNYKKYYDSNKFYLEEQFYTVTENNFEVKTESSNAIITKEKINKIMINKNTIYIFISLNIAYIIKDNYFENIVEYNNFKDFLIEHYKK